MPKKHKPKANGHQQKPKNRKSLDKSFTPPSSSLLASSRHSENASPHPHFSLRDELQQTGRHHSQWSPAVKLRNQTISFVSAGSMHPLDEAKIEEDPEESKSREGTNLLQPNNHLTSDLERSEDAMAHMNLQSTTDVSSPASQAIVMDGAMDIDARAPTTVAQEASQSDHSSLDSVAKQDGFVIDTVGDRSLVPLDVKPRLRASSPTPSNSSDEVILFRGRNDHVITREDPTTSVPDQTPSANEVRTLHVTDALMNALTEPTRAQQEATDAPSASKPSVSAGWMGGQPSFKKEEVRHWVHADGTDGIPDETEIPNVESEIEIPPQSRRGRGVRRRQNRQLRQLQKDLDDEMVQDYIDNMSDPDAFGLTSRPLGGESEEWLSSEMDEDEDGEPIDDIIGDDMSEVDGLESTFVSDEGDEDEDEEGDDSELESDLEYDERERWEDEADLRQRQQDAMTDEEIARILSKQESLGIGGDELVLFDDSGFGDLETARAGLEAFSGNALDVAGRRNKHGLRRSKKGRKSDHFPDASLMADVIEQDPYGGFDVMDFDRPSLRVRNKGRKSGGSLPAELAELSDESLLENLQSSWANDRSKKRAKKEEREELRALGLLGGGKGKNGLKGKADLSQKYSEGMTLNNIKEELREFLDMEEHTTKAFPPMSKIDRKVLHNIAGHFNLKSKSQGSGKTRFTIVIKTQRTIEWSSEHWNWIQNKADRGFLPNMNMKGKKKGPPINKAGRGGGFSKAAVSYTNGEVVGASAPELAASNFGRRLMEKMGWEKGMALGKEGGEGRLLVPVEARIKSGKAGLG